MPLYRVEVNLGADFKNTSFCLIDYTVFKCSYFKICVSVRLTPLYESSSGTINDMKTAQGTRPCSKVILHVHCEIFRYALF